MLRRFPSAEIYVINGRLHREGRQILNVRYYQNTHAFVDGQSQATDQGKVQRQSPLRRFLDARVAAERDVVQYDKPLDSWADDPD